MLTKIKTIFLSLILTLCFVSTNAFSASDKAIQALEFVMSHHGKILSDIFKNKQDVWQTVARNATCKDKEEAKRLFGVIVNAQKTYADRVVKAYTQENSDTTKALPIELIRDISNFTYRNYMQGYLLGYSYRAKVYLRYYPQIKNDFCDKAAIAASAMLDQIVEEKTSSASHDYVKQLKLYRDYRILKANAKVGQAAFYNVFRHHTNYVDSYVYALILNKKQEASTLYHYLRSNELKKEFYTSLSSLTGKKAYHLKNNDNRSLLVNDAYMLRLQGYTLGFLSFYTQMKTEYPELNEIIAKHQPEYLAKNMKKFNDLQQKKK